MNNFWPLACNSRNITSQLKQFFWKREHVNVSHLAFSLFHLIILVRFECLDVFLSLNHEH